MNNEYEIKIKELTERIEQLEKIEQKRARKKKIKIAWTITKILIVIILLLKFYYSIYKPYQKKITTLEEKLNTAESFIQEKLDVIRKYSTLIK